MLRFPRLESIRARYGAALGATVAAFLIRVALNPLLGDSSSYTTFFGAVAFAAIFCGLGPSIAVVIVATLAGRYVVIHHALRIADWPGLADTLLFVLVSAIIVSLGEAIRHRLKGIQTARAGLESQVAERTAELATANHSLRELTGQILHLQDQERRRIARELHDSAGQSLAVISMRLTKVRAELNDQVKRLTKTAETAEDSLTLVRETLTDIRTVCYLLHPPMLDEAGLAAALRWYIDGFAARSNIGVDLELSDDFGRLPQDVETAIFRVVQECLANILRHSESSVARIRLIRSFDEVRVEVQDEGKGISLDTLSDMNSANTLGVGVRGMHERIRQLGGTLEIQSAGQGKGTLVAARLPVPPALNSRPEASEDTVTSR